MRLTVRSGDRRSGSIRSTPVSLQGESDAGLLLTTESVEVSIAADGLTLAGNALMPADPSGGVLFLNGSGPLDRDSNLPGQRLNIANTFARAVAGAGWASLRFDKRGVGASSGDALTGGFDDETADADAALDLAALTCPVLAVTGAKDLQVDPADVAAIGAAVNGVVSR